MKQCYLLIFFLSASTSFSQSATASTSTEWSGGIPQHEDKVANKPPWETDLWIAPNPSFDFLDVYSKTRPTGNTTITVYNMLGGRLYTFEPTILDNSLILHADASNWYPGTYLVRIESNGTVLKTMRFVKR